MEHLLTPEEQQWLKESCSPEKLRKNLRRVHLLIPIEALALALCIATLCIEGHNTLLCALSGLLFVQLLYLIPYQQELKKRLKLAEKLKNNKTE